MKATLNFDLTNFDDKRLYECTVKGMDMALALNDLSEKLRSIEKHGTESLTREQFYEILHKHNIYIDELVY